MFFNIRDFQYLHSAIRSGIAKTPYFVKLLLGASINFPTVEYLINAMRYLPKNSVFEVIGLGPVQFPLLAAAIILGAHVRVGMEDNI